MAHTAPDRASHQQKNIAVIISLTLIVWLQHIDPNGGQDWGQLSNFRNMGLKSFAILSCCGKTEQIGVFRELCLLRTNDKELAALFGNMESTTLESSLSWGQIKFHRWQNASWVASAAERYECSRLNSVQERTMPEFRCKMLNERGGILFSADITADTPDGAIRQAAEVYHTSNLSSPSRRVHAFEVWSGTSRLFPPPLNA